MGNTEISMKVLGMAFHDHYESLHRYAYTITKENEAAKDIVQQVFLALWENKTTINITTSLKSYLYRAVYNTSLNYVTRTKKTFSPNNGVESGQENIGLSIEIREMEKHLHAAIANLPQKCKEVFLKRREEGKTNAEVAQEMGIAIKTVEAQMTKAIKILRDELAHFLICLIILMAI